MNISLLASAMFPVMNNREACVMKITPQANAMTREIVPVMLKATGNNVTGSNPIEYKSTCKEDFLVRPVFEGSMKNPAFL